MIGIQNTHQFENKHNNCIPINTDDIHTSYMNQMNMLKNKETNNPEPRKQLIIDLKTLIMSYNNIQEQTIVLVDTNDGLFNRLSLLPTFLSNTGIIPLISNPEDYPATCSRGSQCIEFIFGLAPIVENIISLGMTSFFDKPWPHTNHQGLFVDLDIVGLLGATLHNIPPTIPRKITSKS
jgi:hypothetical protein